MTRANLNQVTFLDDRTFTVGDRVAFSTKYGTNGEGVVIGFGRNCGTTTIKIKPDAGTNYTGMYDRWSLLKGGHFNRLCDHGIHGGEITKNLTNGQVLT